MAATIKYLFQHGKKKTWHFVRRIPDDILRTPGHAKYFDNLARVNKSLKTSNLEEALQKYHKLMADFEDRVLLARGGNDIMLLQQQTNTQPTRRLSQYELQDFQKTFFRTQVSPFIELIHNAKSGDVDAIRELRERSDGLAELTAAYEEFRNGNAHPLRRLQDSKYYSVEPLVVPLHWRRSKDEAKRELAEDERLLYSRDVEMETARIMKEMNLYPNEETKLLLHLNEAEHAVGEYIENIKKGDLSYKPARGFLSDGNKKATTFITLLELSKKYLEDNRHLSKGWLDKVEKVVALYNDFHGIDKNLENITRKDIQSFIYKLKFYPANAALRFPNKSFQEVLKANEIEDYPCLNYKTIKDGYLTTLAALFNYALGLGCIDNIPTYKVMVPGKKQYRVSKDEPFEIDELNRIFKQPIYTGFKSMARRYTPGNKIIRDHIYWVPIIALYTGMRCTEIACIKIADIDLETAYPHLSIIGTKENPFKTSNAQRRIPLVKALDKLGFFEFIRSAKEQGHVRLFEDWKPLKIKYSNTAFIKRFNDRIVPAVLGERYDPKNENYDPNATRPKSFHALRKNFKTLLIHGKVNQAVADQIIGHAQSAMDKRYVGKFLVKDLYEEVKDLDYKGLDLGHLWEIKGDPGSIRV